MLAERLHTDREHVRATDGASPRSRPQPRGTVGCRAADSARQVSLATSGVLLPPDGLGELLVIANLEPVDTGWIVVLAGEPPAEPAPRQLPQHARGT